MAKFEGAVLEQTVAVARSHRIEPAALLAVVEVESAGKSMEIDGKTPCLLFERHIFHRELRKANKQAKLNNAVAMGLANSSWQPKSQYRDQGTSQGRIDLFKRASIVDQEAAIRSCSWGVGQTMGFLAEEMHFKDAQTMLAYMVQGGVPAQVECMVREIENKNLVRKLNTHDWAGFAKVYNGPSYKQNRYDSKMAAAWARWSRVTLPQPVAPKPVEVSIDVKPVEKPTTPTKQVAAASGIGAAIAAAWAALRSWPVEYVALGGLIIVLIIITLVVLWRRHNAVQLGVLGEVATS